MRLTVRDIQNFPELSKLQLIAGAGGLDREVVHCGILDYEYDREVADKYSDYNYDTPGKFFTLTSFLYAKDNPALIFDAVKRLISKEGSGLIIKNIYRLPIGDNVIRLANSRNFPIFVLNDSHPFFEDIIIHISREQDKKENLYLAGNATDRLLACRDDEIKIQEYTADICANIQSDILAIYLKPYGKSAPEEESLDSIREKFIKAETALADAGLLKPEDAFYIYRKGFMLIHSEQRITDRSPEETAAPYLDILMNISGIKLQAGMSDIHHRKNRLRNAIIESLCASAFDMSYGALGIYQLIIPYCRDRFMQDFSSRMLMPLFESDEVHNTENILTLSTFIHCGAGVERTADMLGQHRNTIRYRLKKIADLTGADPLTQAGCEQLSMALRIRECAERLADLPEFQN